MRKGNQPEPVRQSASLEQPVSRIAAAPMTLILCSLAALIFSQLIRTTLDPVLRLVPSLILPFAFILFVIGIVAVDRGHLPKWLEKFLTTCSSWLGIRPEQFISLIYSLIFSIITCAAAGFSYRMYSPVIAILSWLLSIGLVIFGGWKKPAIPFKLNRTVWISASLLFMVSFAIRSINTTNIPIVLSGDEASSGLFSIKFISGEVNNFFITGWFSFPSLHNFLQSLSIRIFGQTTEGLRLLASFGGALTVVLVYLIGEKMYGNLGGWAAALFLTGLHYHNHFSRIGLNNIWDGFFFILVLGFLWVGWKRNSRLAWLLSGFGLGMAQYFYATGRILLIIIPVWVILVGFFDRKRLKRSVPDFVAALCVAMIVVLPLAWFYLKNFTEFLAPMNRVSIFGTWLTDTSAQLGMSKTLVILNQLKLGILGYIEEPTRYWYQPNVPILRAIPAIIFLIGLAFTFIRPKDERGQLLWIWLGAIALAVGLSESAPAAQRYVAAAPALVLMVGFGLIQLTQLFIKWLPKRAAIFNVLLIASSILLAVDDLGFYFLKYTPDSNFSGFNGLVAQKLANRLKDEPAGTELFFCGYPEMGYDSISSLPFLAPQIDYINVFEPWDEADLPVASAQKDFFVFLPGHEADQAAMENEYPGGVWSEAKYKPNETLYWLYELDRN